MCPRRAWFPTSSWLAARIILRFFMHLPKLCANPDLRPDTAASQEALGPNGFPQWGSGLLGLARLACGLCRGATKKREPWRRDHSRTLRSSPNPLPVSGCLEVNYSGSKWHVFRGIALGALSTPVRSSTEYSVRHGVILGSNPDLCTLTPPLRPGASGPP